MSRFKFMWRYTKPFLSLKPNKITTYGDFIFYRPRLTSETLILWLAPAIFLLFGVIAVVLIIRRRRAASVREEVLSEPEQKRLQALLREGEKDA